MARWVETSSTPTKRTDAKRLVLTIVVVIDDLQTIIALSAW
jgi:hypothetical protein